MYGLNGYCKYCGEAMNSGYLKEGDDFYIYPRTCSAVQLLKYYLKIAKHMKVEHSTESKKDVDMCEFWVAEAGELFMAFCVDTLCLPFCILALVVHGAALFLNYIDIYG